MSRVPRALVAIACIWAFCLLMPSGQWETWGQAAGPVSKSGAPPSKAGTPPSKPVAPGAKPAAPAPKAAPPAAPEPPDIAKRTAELRASLDTKRVTFDAQKIKLSEAVRTLASIAKVNIVLDDTLPTAKDREVTLSLRDVPLREALAKLTRPDLTFEVLQEAICISTREGITDLVASAPVIPEDLTAEGQSVVTALKKKLITFSFENVPVQDAVAVLGQLTGVKITLDRAIPPPMLRTVNLTLTDVHLESALFYLTGKDLNAAVSLGAFFISTNEGVQKELERRKTVRKHMAEKEKFGALLATPVTCEFAKTPLNDAVAVLAKAAKARIVFDPSALRRVGRKALVSAKLEAVPLEDAFGKILPAELDYVVNEEGVITIVLKEPRRREAPAEPEKKK